MTTITRRKYQGGTPGADASNYTLWDSTADKLPPAAIESSRRYLLSILNSHACTLVGQVSADSGTTWTTFYSEALAARTTILDRAIRFDPHRDVKFYVTNGGSAQTTFYVAQAVDDGEGGDAEPNVDSVFNVALASNVVMKAAPGRLRWLRVQIDSSGATDIYYLQIWNLAAAPADATAVTAANTLHAVVAIPHTNGTDTSPLPFYFEDGLEFEVGCTVGISTTQFTKTAAAAYLVATGGVE